MIAVGMLVSTITTGAHGITAPRMTMKDTYEITVMIMVKLLLRI